jgi:3-oxoacyl-[acyl-carrier protein] reductase
MRNILVSGTTGDLGGSIAQVLLEEGYRVIGVARREAVNTVVGSHDNYVHTPFDLKNLEDIPQLIAGITEQFGPIYGLVNNSALGLDSVLATMHARDIQALLTVNLNAPIELAKHAVRGMLVAREGRIINITSVVAKTGYNGLSVYAATKAGLEGFTRSLAREVGKRGITVNNVAPGFMPTDMTAGLSDEKMAQVVRRTPLGRLVTSAEVADSVAFLLSAKATGITGQTITVDGGASS